jgi:asparagine synthase (glutamine-hydrolysing)
MCGICGFISTSDTAGEAHLVERMAGTLTHRGPDGAGVFTSEGVGLGHRRLSIIDVESGSQPLSNEDGTVVVVYNGEIFNYRELADDLRQRGHCFKTQSDTETLVHLYEEYGIEMVHRLRGMFAFALYDGNSGGLYLVRDRFGIKPLYYHIRNGTMYFASEIRSILAAGYRTEVNRAAVHAYLQTRFAHTDETIFKNVFRLPEGCYLQWKRGNHAIRRYYQNPMSVSPVDVSDGDAERTLEASLDDAVKAWMIADVPVGAYLSGGVDSSLVTEAMTRHTSHAVRTFCVDFHGETSEASAAEQMAMRLGCEHTTVFCGVDEALQLPAVVETLEEPVGDPVVVAQFFLSRATRSAGMKTVLTGDGADETLGGYQYLRAIVQAQRLSRIMPGALMRMTAGMVRTVPLSVIDALADVPLGVANDARDRLAAALRIVPRRDVRELYDLLLALNTPDDLRHLYTEAFYREAQQFPRESFAGDAVGDSVVARVLSLQYRKWLPANINLKQDKLCMAHSVENRTPFLDHLFVERMAALPDRYKIRGQRGKVLLRRVAAKRLPLDRSAGPKVPFHLPIRSYLKDRRFRDLIDDTLDDVSVAKRGFVRPEYVRSLKAQVNDGGYLLGKKLMALVILELWHRTFVDQQ